MLIKGSQGKAETIAMVLTEIVGAYASRLDFLGESRNGQQRGLLSTLNRKTGCTSEWQSLVSAMDGDDLRQDNIDVVAPSRSQHRHWKSVTDGQSDWNFVSPISTSAALNVYACGRSEQVWFGVNVLRAQH
ncbi:hypothetical protein NL676_010917 [Syzygium grande]|nr:hypothetical protein NL676_010917 [Syzygium grande]